MTDVVWKEPPTLHSTRAGRPPGWRLQFVREHLTRSPDTWALVTTTPHGTASKEALAWKRAGCDVITDTRGVGVDVYAKWPARGTQ